jgi:hypothetical protein
MKEGDVARQSIRFSFGESVENFIPQNFLATLCAATAAINLMNQ